MTLGLWDLGLRTLRDQVRLVPRTLNINKLSGWPRLAASMINGEACGRLMVVILMNSTNTTSDE